MIESREIAFVPAHACFAVGYACVCAWAIVLLFSPAFGSPSDIYAAPMSMLPGLVACLSSIVFLRTFPSISGKTAFVVTASVLMAMGTLLYTHPAFAAAEALRLGGLALSGFFAIVVIMSWFDTFADLQPRAIIITTGCALSIAAITCWAILSCPAAIASTTSSLLPLLSMTLLPKMRDGGSENDASRTMREVIAAAIPARTLLGLAVTFFIVRSIATLAPEFEQFNSSVTPISLLVPLSITAFFIGSALLVKKRIDPSIFYKILLSCFAGFVFLLASSTGITAALVFYANLAAEVITWTVLALWAKKTPVILSCFAGFVFLLASSTGITAALVFYANLAAEVITWTVLALWAKKTPVKPHLVFAIGWIAECAGNTLGQVVTPLFAAQGHLFFAVAIVAILLAVSFAFSEGHLILEVDFEDEDRADTAADKQDSKKDPIAASQKADIGQDSKNQEPKARPAMGDELDKRMDAFAASYDISPRERDVLELWIAGRGMKYIENALFISESTVKSHLRSIYRKCDTHNRDETISLYEKETSGE